MKTLFATILGLTIVTSSFAAEKKQSTADHLQNVSVTIRSEGQYSNGEGSPEKSWLMERPKPWWSSKTQWS